MPHVTDYSNAQSMHTACLKAKKQTHMTAKDYKLSRGSRSFCLLGLHNMPNETSEHSLHFNEILITKKVTLLFLKQCLRISPVFSKAGVNMMDNTWFRWLVQQTYEDLQATITADKDKSIQ